MHAGRIAVAATWLAALVGTVLVVVLVPADRALEWLALTAGLAVAVGIAAQLAVAERSGFVVRLASASAGAFVLVVAGALVVVASA